MKFRQSICGAAIFVGSLFTAAIVHGAPPAALQKSLRAGPIDPIGMQQVDLLTDFYKTLERFTVKTTFTMQGGVPLQKREGSFAVLKPAQISAEVKAGDASLLRSDGRNLLVVEPAKNTYFQTPAPPSVSPIIQEFAPGLSDLVDANPKEKLLDGVKKLEALGDESAGGVACRHLRFTQDAAVVELWIEAGKQPLLRKMFIKAGETTIEVHFDEWDLAPKFDAKTFDVTPPAGAKKIDPTAP